MNINCKDCQFFIGYEPLYLYRDELSVLNGRCSFDVNGKDYPPCVDEDIMEEFTEFKEFMEE